MRQSLRTCWLRFLASLGALALAAAAGRKFSPPKVDPGAAEALRAECSALAYATNERVAAARAGISRAWDAEERHAFLGKLVDDWTVREDAGRVVLAAKGPQLERWSDYLARIRALERERAIRLDAVEIAATGVRAERRFTAVAVAFRFVGRPARADAGPAQASARPPRGEEIGRPRPDRSGASLRSGGRPTSAEPPAVPLRSPLRSVPTLRGPGPE